MSPTISRSAILFLFLATFVVVSHVASSNVIVDSLMLSQKIGANRTIKVDPEGKDGEFTSVQAAIDSVPDGNAEWIIVQLREGVYNERVTIPPGKPFIFLRGNGMWRTIITSSQTAAKNVDSATFRVQSNNFIAWGVSFKNEAPPGLAYSAQNNSVAAVVSGDKVAFYHCAFTSEHNTLFDNKGRHYYETCYIQGCIDFIFGRARSVYHNCEIFLISDKRISILGSITAQNRESAAENSGFVFIKGTVSGVGPDEHLGRAKGAFSRVIFAQTHFSNSISAEGWTNWSYNGDTKDLFHAEYDCLGPGADTSKRSPWTKLLTKEEVEPFLSVDFIDGKEWVPVWV